MSKQWDDDAFEGSSGLHKQFVIDVRKSSAVTPEGWSNPTWVLEGELTLPDGTKTDGDLRMSIGAFEPGDDGGTYIIHQTQDVTKKVGSSTGMMIFISSIKNAEGGAELKAHLQENSRIIDDVDLMNRDLSIWEGLRLSIDHKKVERLNPTTQEVKMKDVAILSAYLGRTDGSAPASAPAAAATNGSGGGDIDPKAFTSYVAYLTAFTEAGGDASDPRAQRTYFDEAVGASA